MNSSTARLPQPTLGVLASVEELYQLKSWQSCYPGPNNKRPYGGPTTAPTTLQEASSKFPEVNFGLQMHKGHDIIIVDVDGLDKDTLASCNTIMDVVQADIPPTLKALLVHHPTYCEISLSGAGLHMVYKTDKETLKQNKEKHQAHNTKFKGSLFISNQFVVFTGKPWPVKEYTNKIATLSTKEVYKYILNKRETSPITQNLKVLPARRLPKCTIKDIENWLEVIPIKPNSRVIKAYQELGISEIDDYTHWLTVGMALAYYGDISAAHNETFQLWNSWSAQDEVKYPGVDELYDKYKTLAPAYDDNDVTYATLAKLYHSMWLEWPKPKIVKGKVTKYPLNTEIANFAALVDYYEIEISENEINHALRVYKASDAKKWFTSGQYQEGNSLAVDVWKFCQDNGFLGLSYQQASAFSKLIGPVIPVRQYNPVTEWILSKPWDGIDRLEPILASIHFSGGQNTVDLSKNFVTKNLFGIIRSCFYNGPFKTSTGITVLQGAESTYKSTWLRNLLPPELHEYVGSSQTDLQTAAIKELQLEAAQFQMIIYDEIERIATAKRISTFKNFLVQEYDMYRPLFGNRVVQTPRRVIFWGTTNEASFALGDTGSRRVQLCPVRRCDTKALLRIDRQQLFAQLLDIYNKTSEEKRSHLWALNREEISLVSERNEKTNVRSDIQELLLSLYKFKSHHGLDVEAPDAELGRICLNVSKSVKDGRLVTLRQLQRILEANFSIKAGVPALKATLIRMCGRYTDTMYADRTVTLRGRSFTLSAGGFKPNDRKYYVLPERFSDEEEERILQEMSEDT